MIQIFLGPPGTGKTETSIRIVEKYLEKGVPPDRIAYLAFTRRASLEAKHRAMERFDLTASELPYFRTLHSFAYLQLGILRNQIMSRKHFEEVSHWLKIGTFFGKEQEAGPFRDFGYGDKYLELINIARITQTSLKNVYETSPSRHLVTWNNLEYVARGLSHYKKVHSLLDYTDMLERFICGGFCPKLEVVIIDEAQDLSALQWKMVHQIAQKAEHVYVAGDDDQAIYRWAGADIDHFINLAGAVHTLSQSFRIPKSHHEISQRLIKSVFNRRDKQFLPRAENGTVSWYRHSEQVNLSDGDWLLLARTVRGANQLEEEVRSRGYLYDYEGSASADSKVIQAITIWEKMREGYKFSVTDIRKVYKLMRVHNQVAYGFKGLQGTEEDTLYGIAELQESFGLLTDSPWEKALGLVSERDARYIAACLKKGERLTGKPRVRISTIHRAKGAQADNVCLITDISKRSNSRWSAVEQDDEARVFYVGLTRAKQTLHLIHPMHGSGYELPA
tara:strand:+ start:1469 stop:2980 length:1512 start_codon:yes stop_codon:yes gene_type:complete